MKKRFLCAILTEVCKHMQFSEEKTMSTPNFKRTKLACYSSYFTMSTVFCLPPLLFVTFNKMYGISWTLLGTLVLVNFCTQLTIDLIFSFFSKYFNVKKTVRIMPLITSLGMLVYAFVPTFFPEQAYLGLVVGTVIFSVSAGLSEVLLSPMIAAIPSDNPQSDMSFLHSLYAAGILTMIVVSSLSLKIIGNENWMYLTFVLALLPIISSVLFTISPIPDMDTSNDGVPKTEKAKKKSFGLALCVGCIFFGACAENVMTNWISGYMESALYIDKTLGDILGMAVFAVFLGSARLIYAKYGKNIMRTLLLGMTGAAICYLVAGLSSNVVLAFVACIMTGFCTAMLWPGSLIMMEENVPGVGVAAYALMAAGGDFGSSLAPQLMGIVVDNVSASDFALRLGASMNLSPEQIGMKAGMLVSAVFPVIGAVLVVFIIKYFKKQSNK